jgi:hypothetical protein
LDEQTLEAKRELVIATLIARARRLAESTEDALVKGRELSADERHFLLGLIDVTLEWYNDLESQAESDAG